jgi:hypothetical protein
MKTLIAISLLTISGIIYSQDVLLTIEPLNFQTGIIYHQPINKIGVYGKARYAHLDKSGLKTDYFKYGVGVSIEYLGGFSPINFIVGVNYSQFANMVNESSEFDLARVKRVSVDLGFIANPGGRFIVCAITDPLNWETEIGIGIRF